MNRGEWAALLDPSLDINANIRNAPKVRLNAHVVDGGFEEVRKPLGETRMPENRLDPLVVDRVECFCGVQKEDSHVFIGFDSVHENFVQVDQVISALDPGEEAFLGTVDQFLHFWHDSECNCSC